MFDCTKLGDIPQVPIVGLAEYVWRKDMNFLLTSKFTQGRVNVRPRKMMKGEMKPFHKL